MTTQLIKILTGLMLILGVSLNAHAASTASFDTQFQLTQSEAPADGEEKKKVEEEEPDC